MYENTIMLMLRFYLSSKAKNNDYDVMSDIEYNKVAKAMKLSEVTDVRSDNLPEINIRRENRVRCPMRKKMMIITQRKFKRISRMKIQKLQRYQVTTKVTKNQTTRSHLTYINIHFQMPYLLNTKTIPVSVNKLKFKVHRGQVQKDFIDAFTGLDM